MISVIIPTYNRPNLIVSSLTSVLSQTYTDLEIVVVDGSNNDETKIQISKFNDKRIKYLKTKNISAANSRNIGIDEANGDFIAFNDDDDIWCSTKLESQLKLFNIMPQKKFIVYSKFCKISKKHIKTIPDKSVLNKHGNIYEEILLRNFIGLPTVMLPLSCCREEKFDEQLKCMEDWDWMIRLAKKYPFEFISESLVSVGDTPNSVNKSNYTIKAASYIIIYNKHLHDIKHLPQVESKHLLSIGSNLCLSGEIHDGRNYLLKSMKIGQNKIGSFIVYSVSSLGKNCFYFIFKTFEKLTHRQP